MPPITSPCTSTSPVWRPGKSEFPRAQAKGQDDDEYAEQRDRSISQLFVAMTRARDLLYVLSSGGPADLIADAADRFEPVSRP